jgi:hypothetical protein
VLERVAPREGWAREEARTVRAPAARARDTAPPPDPAAYTALVAWERAACGAPGWADEDERARAEGELIARLAR